MIQIKTFNTDSMHMITLTKSAKAQGIIKHMPEDFIVEEITANGRILQINTNYTNVDLGMESTEGNFTVFVLQKKEWNTTQALRALAKKFRRGVRSTGFAGTKDRTSISTQLCSIYGIKPSMLNAVHVKDLSINGAWQSSIGIKLGDLLGNRFTISIRSINEEKYNMIGKAEAELNDYGFFPNYFGTQRFGVRDNNTIIGLSILKNDFESAAMAFLTDSQNEISIDAVEARKRLEAEQDFKKALEYFPQYLKYERLVIEHLSRYPDNYANAMRRLPRSLLLMFVHSVEDMIFNQELEQRLNDQDTKPHEGDIVCNVKGISCDISTVHSFDSGSSNDVLPVASILGYNSKPNSFEEQALASLGVKLDDFKVAGMPELNCKGSYRLLFAPFKGLAVERMADDTAKISFSLPSGSYATVLMNELITEMTKPL